MTKRIEKGFYYKNNNNFVDVDIHDFIELIEKGYKSQEIANELGVSKEQVERLIREINNDY